MQRIMGVPALLAAATGLSATVFWWIYGGQAAFVGVATPGLALVVVAIAVLSSVNLAIRWFRWHFLTRRYLQSVPTRTSLAIYFGTLPAFATPLYLGELIRTALVARRVPEARRVVLTVWAVERIADALTLVVFLIVATSSWPLLAAFAIGLFVITRLFRRVEREWLRVLLAPRTVALVGATSLAAWLMPVLGLWGIVGQLGDPISTGAAAEVFSLGTLGGGLALLPLGAGVSGSSMIFMLNGRGMAFETAVVSIALFRLGTTWYALALGLLAFVRWRRVIVSVVREGRVQEHFDALAEEYDTQIPAAVRERVVTRKVEVTARWLREVQVAPGAKGLEIGCGHGWYAVELARLGYPMSACDRSTAQARAARRYIASHGKSIQLLAADARALPYPDGCFDFAYGVNVIHHIIDPGVRRHALGEIVRVLRPGGSFFLHEINTKNPLFALYMGYLFPLIREIDDGTEAWIKPDSLPPVAGATWDADLAYLTFLPDFTPRPVVEMLSGIERLLERSRFRSWSAHYVARLVKREG